MEMETEELDARIEAQVQEWSSNSNECFTVDLIRADGSKAASFPPDFTYPIFGEEEAIFGYQDLAINLTFAAHNLRPHLSVSYGAKFTAQGEVKPTDVHEALRDFLPAVAFSSEPAERTLRDQNASEFAPPGEKVHAYQRDGEQYEIWCATLSDPAAKQLLENMEILVPLFIEGGTMLQIEQDWTTQRWKLFLLYQLRPISDPTPTYSEYSLLGYGTSYRVFTFPDRNHPLPSDLDLFTHSSQSVDHFLPSPESAIPNDNAPTSMPNNITSPLDLPSRERLSQFLILPPFQRAGHGLELYNTMYRTLTQPQNVREFTVEDPNEAFDDLRDFCDLLYLRSSIPEFAELRINTNIPPDRLTSATDVPIDLIVPASVRNEVMKRTKIMQRQFDRLVEMHTLSFIPPFNRNKSRLTRREKSSNENDKAFYIWRLYVKQRLYIFNRDQLAQLEREERSEKLESALDSVIEAYEKMIERVEKREKQGVATNGATESDNYVEEGAPRVARPKKRKVIDEAEESDEDAEEDEEGEGNETEVNGHSGKKARVE